MKKSANITNAYARMQLQLAACYRAVQAKGVPTTSPHTLQKLAEHIRAIPQSSDTMQHFAHYLPIRDGIDDWDDYGSGFVSWQIANGEMTVRQMQGFCALFPYLPYNDIEFYDGQILAFIAPAGYFIDRVDILCDERYGYSDRPLLNENTVLGTTANPYFIEPDARLTMTEDEHKQGAFFITPDDEISEIYLQNQHTDGGMIRYGITDIRVSYRTKF